MAQTTAGQFSRSNTQATTQPWCFHCGEPCANDHIHIDDKPFCCEGCKMVYEILNENDLCRYYEIDEKAGVSLKGRAIAEYAYLDDEDVRARLIDFSDGEQTRVTFFIPQIHCASCLWLLENLYRLSPGVRASKVHFPKKEVYITFSESDTSLRKVVELLSSIGYAPAINLSDLDGERPVVERDFYYRLGVAGFAFGNIMLLSFPEYLGLDRAADPFFFKLFGYLNILLAIPVVFYSGRDYLLSAWRGLRHGNLNLDVPISLGILTLFGRSVFDILTQADAGYLDSLAGLVFFLLIGKWFQQRTYHNISFERDYKSYFPIAARRKNGPADQTVSLDKLEPGDVIIIRHGELIPADSVLLKGEARIDYSFVTGEAEPVERQTGERIYAGGRQTGATIEVSLTRRVSQSYLTQLWNDEAFTKDVESNASRLADRVGRFFTFAILTVAFITLFYWLPRDGAVAIQSFTAVLIIACPCAVALTIPFIFGNVLRILARHEFYLKNTSVIEALSEISAVVFDKTGTLTRRAEGQVDFVSEQPLNSTEAYLVRALVSQSSHPASQQIYAGLSDGRPPLDHDYYQVVHFHEEVGKGIEGEVGHRRIRIGSKDYMESFLQGCCPDDHGVYVQINDEIRGYFRLSHTFRKGTWKVMDYFKNLGPLFLLSGDNDHQRDLLMPLFPRENSLLFRQSPQDKLAFVKALQSEGRQVLMLGDGLNDAGALKQSNAGVVVAEDTNNFTPACDAILRADRFQLLPIFIEFARRSLRLVYLSYGFALIYNIIGLSFAVQGALSPIVAAILMPLSSITIVLLGTLSSSWLGKRFGL